jgi:hypothetical protein
LAWRFKRKSANFYALSLKQMQNRVCVIALHPVAHKIGWHRKQSDASFYPQQIQRFYPVVKRINPDRGAQLGPYSSPAINVAYSVHFVPVRACAVLPCLGAIIVFCHGAKQKNTVAKNLIFGEFLNCSDGAFGQNADDRQAYG